MLHDAISMTPGTVIFLTGDGAEWAHGKGFLPTLQAMKQSRWKIELISWESSCNRWLKEWVDENGVFGKLDDYYTNIIKSSERRPEWGHQPAAPLELGRCPREQEGDREGRQRL